uniref:Succinate:cytochrome c oxidoreductase subunit 4 n=1 Tax=Schizymenia dubyi TaxID=38368 RepID=A0A0E3DBT7_9FLOR|nr:succinate:cytochrome c oxidoreductase subunit 4 [Schizymenia dubyi]
MFNFSWFLMRLITFFIFLGFLVDIEIFLMASGFLFLHINLGLKTILDDYIHIKKINLGLNILMRILMIEMIRYLSELLL